MKEGIRAGSLIIDRHTEGCVDDFFTVASDMQSKVGEVERQKREEYLYRQQRKDNRGRVIGGGFDLGGSLKRMSSYFGTELEMHLKNIAKE